MCTGCIFCVREVSRPTGGEMKSLKFPSRLEEDKNGYFSSLLFVSFLQRMMNGKVPALRHYKCGFWHHPAASRAGVTRGQSSPGEYRGGADTRPCRSPTEFVRRWGKMKGSFCPPCVFFLCLRPCPISQKWSACLQHSLLLLELCWLS